MKKIKRLLRDNSFITLLVIGIILYIIGTFFILKDYNPKINIPKDYNYNPRTNTQCYWTTKGIICNWGKIGD